MDEELEALVARASDPRWIPAIHNYCDRRCARCRFNDRCFAFDDSARDRAGSDHVAAVAAHSLERAIRLMRAYAEREGIDLDAAAAETADDDQTSLRDEIREEPLVIAARDYGVQTWNLLTPLEQQIDDEVASDVRDAIDSLRWLSTMIAPKIYRALAGLVDPLSPADHPTQNDAHGSAKIARLMIADSLAAWRVVNEAGRAVPESPTRALAAALLQIDRDLAARVPRAMEFMRPGFDEAVPGTVRPWSLEPEDEDEENCQLS
jgi:hypothetical protein